jgi:hypothetical protein
MSSCSFLLRVAALWGIACPSFFEPETRERIRRIWAKNLDNIASHSGVCKRKMRLPSIFLSMDKTPSQGIQESGPPFLRPSRLLGTEA